VRLLSHPLPASLLCALLWGSAFPVIKQVYQYWEAQGLERTLPMIFLFAGLRFTFSGLGLLAIGKNLREELRETPLWPLAGLALTQTFLQYVFFYQAVAVSSASLAALLVSTGSLWWMVLAPLVLKSPWPTGKQWLGLSLGGLGVSLAVYAPGVGAGNPFLGTAFMLSATASGAFAVIIFQKIRPTMSSVNATGLSLFLGGLGLTVIGAGAAGSLQEMFGPPVIWSTLWLMLVSAAAFTIWNNLTSLFPVSLLASYRFLIPVCGVLEALIFLPNESAGWGLLVGGFFVLCSMKFAQKSSNLPKKTTS